MHASFFVENASIAYALKNVSGKIWDEDNEKVCVKWMTRASIEQEGRARVRSCLILGVRVPSVYSAPLGFSADINLCEPCWYTPLCAQGAKVRKGGADKGNTGSRQVVHTKPDPLLLPHLLPPSPPQLQSLWNPSLTLQLAMNQQCDVSQEALDIQRLPFYPGMAEKVILW